MDSTDIAIEKIKKALRLAARAGTDGEREAARAAASRIAAANGIAVETVDMDAPSASSNRLVEDGRTFVRPGSEMPFITLILHEHFAVFMVQTVVSRSPYRWRASWVGSSLNIGVARYVFDILRRESARAWTNAIKKIEEAKGVYGENAFPKPTRDAFMRGWFYKIHLKLTEHPLRNDLDVLAAEKKSCEEALEKLRNETEGGIEDKKPRKASENAFAVRLGYNAADSVNLSRPCSGPAAKPRRQIRPATAIGHRR